MTPSWTPVSQLTLADQAYKAIRSRILGGDLRVGQFVREQEVSAALGVSRTPIREALGRLSSEGFLERIPHRGFRVPEDRWDTLLELYPIVSSLEVLAGKLALPKLRPQDVEVLRELNNALAEESEKGGDVRRKIELNSKFHEFICQRSGSQRLCDLLSDLRSQLGRLEVWYYSQPDATSASVKEHAQIIEAIEAGDHAGALAILENNMALTWRRLQEEAEEEANPGADEETAMARSA
jgi:DNA-binding GntR family transcriptional regulator